MKDSVKLKKDAKKLYDKHYVCRPGVAFSMEKEQYDKIFKNVKIVKKED